MEQQLTLLVERDNTLQSNLWKKAIQEGTDKWSLFGGHFVDLISGNLQCGLYSEVVFNTGLTVELYMYTCIVSGSTTVFLNQFIHVKENMNSITRKWWRHLTWPYLLQSTPPFRLISVKSEMHKWILNKVSLFFIFLNTKIYIIIYIVIFWPAELTFGCSVAYM